MPCGQRGCSYATLDYHMAQSKLNHWREDVVGSFIFNTPGLNALVISAPLLRRRLNSAAAMLCHEVKKTLSLCFHTASIMQIQRSVQCFYQAPYVREMLRRRLQKINSTSDET